LRVRAYCRVIFCLPLVLCAFSTAQNVELKGKVQLTRNGRRIGDASKAVIWLVPLGTTPVPEVPRQDPSEIPQLVQKDKSFHPSLLVIPAGGKVEFPNHDPFFHNVFSLFDGKRFDLGLYESGTTQFVQFDKPGISYIFCNIHAQMSAVVIALTTPYYSISNWRGEIDIPSVVPGRYQIRVFHPSVSAVALHAMEREITVAPSDNFLGTLVLEESNLEVAHKNKYGRDYDPPDPDNPAYARQ
jgi:plastocyanin